MKNSNPHWRAIDEHTGFNISDDFQRFNQRDEIYCRSLWDPIVKSKKASAFFDGYYMPHAKARGSDGFGQRDYALRNASWHVTNILRDIHRDSQGRKEGFFDHFTSHDAGAEHPFEFENIQQADADLKKVAQLCGADLVGVCAYDERWMYDGIFDEATLDSKACDLPKDLPNVIVVGESMDIGLTETVPSALSGSATGLGYSYDAMTLLTLTQYIRNLGYRAYASMNDSSLAIPLAVQAGLGEVGRHSLLITESFGPRLRLGRIFTDMPLTHSQPARLGIAKFCEICDRCASSCPPKAIPFDAPSSQVHNRSNLIGVAKWTVDAEKCFKFWANQNTDCSICIRTCPFNRDYKKWYHRLWRKLAGSRLRKIALWLDDKQMKRGRKKSKAWWANLS